MRRPGGRDVSIERGWDGGGGLGGLHTVSRPTETVPTNLRAETFLHAILTWRGCVLSS